MIRALRSARRSAVKMRGMAANQLHALLVTAPEDLRERLRGLKAKELAAVAARFRLGQDWLMCRRPPSSRYEALSEEIGELERHLGRLVAEGAPRLISLPAIGTNHAATFLALAGDNPQRLGCEASFAKLCGVSPLEASSGKVVRHRLNEAATKRPTAHST